MAMGLSLRKSTGPDGPKAATMAVGIFDSGLGGLTVLDAVTKRLPDVPVAGREAG